MFARLLAAFCLLDFALLSGQSGPGLVLYLRTDFCPSARSTEYMKHELAPLLAAAGYRLEWGEGRVDTAGKLVVVDLRATLDASGILASTAASGGDILPFIAVNCGNLSRLLNQPLLAESGSRRDFLYGRAMARLVAHELYHVLANTRHHARDGIAKPHFTAGDLLGDHFDFEAETVDRMEPTGVILEPLAGR